MGDIRKVYLDSMYHYQLQQDGDKIQLLQFGTGDEEDGEYDACPKMEHRGPFQPHEGRVIEEFTEGEKVEFIYSSFEAIITADLAGDTIHCGDDISYHLCRRAEQEFHQ